MKPIPILLITAAAAVVAVGLSASSLTLTLSDRCTTTTITITHTITKTHDYGDVQILESLGSCGSQKYPSLEILSRALRDGGYVVILQYREEAPNPCDRHHLIQALVQESYPPRVVITLGLEPTSNICIQCIGVIETRLSAGPYPAGTVISVNGVSVVV